MTEEDHITLGLGALRAMQLKQLKEAHGEESNNSRHVQSKK